MSDRTGKVINHKLEYRLDLILGVSSIVSQSWVLYMISICQERKREA